jgi:hypothetical protein
VPHRSSDFALLALVLVGLGPTLFFGYSPEDWVGLLAMRERSALEALAPIETYPYYRPLWSLWHWCAEHLELPVFVARLAPVLAHYVGCLALLRLGVAMGLRVEKALAAAALVAVAPGTLHAVAWFAAGNKSLTFCFLALAALGICRSRSLLGQLGYAALFGGLALASAENAYMQVLLFPLLAIASPVHRERRWPARLRAAALLLLLALALSILHLSMLPQLAAAADGHESRIAELQRVFFEAPIDATWEMLRNLGRFFVHGIGMADDAPLLGLALLGLVALFGARERGFKSLLLALAIYLVLNLPASLFPYEIHRHHGYLPALGAGIVVATALLRFVQPRHYLPVQVLLIGAVILLHVQARPWGRYCAKAEALLDSVLALRLQDDQKPVLLNLPIEYRAAFDYRFGKADSTQDWPGITLLGTRSQILLPPGQELPDDAQSLVLDYDGEKLLPISWSVLRTRERAPMAWLQRELRPFPDRLLAWSDIVSSPHKLVELPWSRAASGRGTPDPATLEEDPPRGEIRILDSGLRTPGPYYRWELEADVQEDAWAVLGWWPAALPVTHNAGLFTLADLPWGFRTEVLDASAETVLDIETSSSLGLLPALRLPVGKYRLVVHLRLLVP